MSELSSAITNQGTIGANRPALLLLMSSMLSCDDVDDANKAAAGLVGDKDATMGVAKIVYAASEWRRQRFSNRCRRRWIGAAAAALLLVILFLRPGIAVARHKSATARLCAIMAICCLTKCVLEAS